METIIRRQCINIETIIWRHLYGIIETYKQKLFRNMHKQFHRDILNRFNETF